VNELNPPTPVRRVTANKKIAADCGPTTVQRKPMVFCTERPDNPSASVRNLSLPDEAPLTAQFEPASLNCVKATTGRAFTVASDAPGNVVKAEHGLKIIQCFGWAKAARLGGHMAG